MRKIFTDILPKWDKGTNIGKINWTLSIGCKVKFIYDDIDGWVEIIEYNKKKHSIVIKYNNSNYITYTSGFLRCQLTDILGLYHYDFKRNVGDFITTKTGGIIITDCFHKKDNKGKLKRWYKYLCAVDQYIGETSENNLDKLKGCPVCSNQIIVKGINDITTTHPHLVKYFKNIEDTYKYSFCSGAKTWIKCPDCGFEKKMTIANLNNQGFSCNKCSDKISYPNKIAFNVLDQLQVDFQPEYSPNWCKYVFKNKHRQGKYDFYFELNNKEYILEMDGGFHNRNNNISGQTKEESKYIDNEKDRLALEHGIEVIRINCDYLGYNYYTYIRQNILSNIRLNELFDLSNINWNEVLSYCLSSRIKEACDLWNLGIYNSEKLRLKMKLNRATVIRYLTIGNELEWCEYNPYDELLKGCKKAGIGRRLPFICVENEIVFTHFDDLENRSIDIFGEQLNRQGVNKVCNNKQKQYKGYHFKYIKYLTPEEYIKYDIENKLKELHNERN